MEITYENWLFASGGVVGALITLAASYGMTWLSGIAAQMSCRDQMEKIISALEQLSTQLSELNHSDAFRELSETMTSLSALLEQRHVPNGQKKVKEATPKTHINGAASSSKAMK
jgi:mevalonate kinase